MLKPTPPMTNAERQRAFRARNPGYYGRLHAKRRARIDALLAAAKAAKAVQPVPALPAPPQVITLTQPQPIPADNTRAA